MGFFAVATVERKPWGIVGLILNVLPGLGGVGNIVVGIKERETLQWVRGIVQFLLQGIVVGYIWSVVDGIRIFRESTSFVAPAAVPAPKQETVADGPAAAPAKRAAPKSAKKAAKKSAKKAAKK